MNSAATNLNHDYDSIARFYDWAAGWTLMPARREIAEFAVKSGARNVLDIGCGTGLQLCELSGHGLRAVGLDNSPAMLAVARRRIAMLPKEQQSKLRLELLSALESGSLGTSFDLAIISLVLHESDDEPFNILDSAFRLASRVFILDWGMPERNLDYLMHMATHGIERLAGKRHYKAYKDYLNKGALEGLLQRYKLYRANSGQLRVKIVGRKHMALNTMLFMDMTVE